MAAVTLCSAVTSSGTLSLQRYDDDDDDDDMRCGKAVQRLCGCSSLVSLSPPLFSSAVYLYSSGLVSLAVQFCLLQQY